MRVLLAEDNKAVAQDLLMNLKTANIAADHAERGENAFELARVYDYSLLMLKINLPDIGGMEILRRMRSARKSTPVMILAPDELAHLATQAFGSGADDVVVTSVDQAELIARVRAIVRRSAGIAEPVIRAGDLRINLNSREVSHAGRRIQLTSKEFAVLELLVLRRGQVLTKDIFLNHLYGGIDEPEAKIIDVFICKLRKKLQAAGSDKLVETVWGHGYSIREEEGKVAAMSDLNASILAHSSQLAA